MLPLDVEAVGQHMGARPVRNRDVPHHGEHVLALVGRSLPSLSSAPCGGPVRDHVPIDPAIERTARGIDVALK